MSGGTTTARALARWASALVPLLILAVPSPAHAHTDLVEARPADGSVLAHLPESGILVFNGPVAADDLTVTSGARALPVRTVPGEPEALRVGLKTVKETKTVRLEWKLISHHDGHASSGVVVLHIDKHATADDHTPSASSGPDGTRSPGPDSSLDVDWLAASARVLGYLAVVVFVGGLLFLSFLWPAGAGERRSRAVLATSVAVGLFAAVEALGVVVARSDGALTWRDVVIEDFGRAYAAHALLWLLAVVVVAAVLQGGEHAVRRLPWRIAALVVAVGLIRTTGMNAHAAQAGDPTSASIADFLHLTAVSAWVGGLMMLTLCVLPRRRAAELEQVVPRFSRVALTSVLMIVGSGLILTWQVVASVDGFWQTHYAQVLLVKLSAFAAVLLVAVNSRRLVLRGLASAVAAHRRTPVQSLATSVAVESLLVVAVLGAASVLTTSSPGL